MTKRTLASRYTFNKGMFEMAMEPYSIQIGNCYIDRFGVTFEVRAIDKGQVTVNVYQKAGSGGRSITQTSIPMTKFLGNLEGQVSCPDAATGF